MIQPPKVPPSNSEGDRVSSDAPPADLRSHTASAATMWLTEGPGALSVWRGEVEAPDRLRVDSRDGSVHELRLDLKRVRENGILRLGRSPQVGTETNDLVYPDVASRLAVTLRHDGFRWWLMRRDECSVPVQVGARSLQRLEEGPLVHGTCVVVGGMRAVFTDRRFISSSVPAGAVDAHTGLLGRVGLEQEVASALKRSKSAVLVCARNALDMPSTGSAGTPPPSVAMGTDYSPLSRLAFEIHRAFPSRPVAITDGTVILVVSEQDADGRSIEATLGAIPKLAPTPPWAVGAWKLEGEGLGAGRELELAIASTRALAEKRRTGGGAAGVADLRAESPIVEIASIEAVGEAAQSERRATLLFAIEDQASLTAAGKHVVAGLEQELAAVVKAQAGAGAIVAPVATGVVAAVVTKRADAAALANAIQCDWHARPPVLDGRAELPRTLSWEIAPPLQKGQPVAESEIVFRARELARECSDPHGVLSSLSGGLPFPIAGRVSAVSSARSAIERVKMLFDVLEGTWRFMAVVLASAYFVRRVEPGQRPAGFDAFAEFAKRNATRDGLALGTWRELARHAAKGLETESDPVSTMAREVLGVRLSQNQTFDALSNLLQAERNAFAHGHYTEARAAADLPEFEQMTRTLLRALRPLGNWTLVSVERTEPDMYGDQQSVEFVDHTGPWASGTRRRIGLNSPLRLANVTYLARWREGLVLPLEPFIRRLSNEARFDVYWMDHLPRGGACSMSAVVGGEGQKSPCDLRRLPPLMRMLVEGATG